VFSSLPLADVLPDIGISAAAAALRCVAVQRRRSPRRHFAARLALRASHDLGRRHAGFISWGRSIGRTKMGRAVEPQEIWEGAVANLAGSLLVGALAGALVGVGIVDMLAMAALGNIARPIPAIFSNQPTAQRRS